MGLYYFKNQSDAEGTSILPPYVGFIDDDKKTIMFASAEGKIEHLELIVDSNKLDKHDDALNTSDKTIVGAINEVASTAKTAETSAQSALSSVQSIQSSLSNKADLSTVTQLSNTLISVQTSFELKDADLQQNLEDFQDTISFERGEMAAADCVGWYTISSGLSGKTMEAKYNLYGDYCILSVQNLHLCDGWHDMFYSLPVAPIENSGVVGENSQGELTYCATTIHEGVSVMKLHRAGVSNVGFKESTISFVLTYKYK